MRETELLKQKIEKLKKYLVKDSINENEISKINQIFQHFTFVSGLTYKTKIGRFLRVTINSRVLGKEERIIEVKYLENPPKEKVNNYGRANLKNQSVLYATDNPLTALAEMRPQINQLVTISTWKLNTDRAITVYPVFKNSPKNDKINNLMTIKASIEYSNFKNKFGYSQDLLNQIDLIIQFICDCFTKDVNDDNNNDYYLSAHYSNEIFNKLQNGEIDAILYPSVRQSLELTNIVMKATSFKDNYILERVEESKLIDFKNNRWILEGIGDSTNFKNGKIIW